MIITHTLDSLLIAHFIDRLNDMLLLDVSGRAIGLGGDSATKTREHAAHASFTTSGLGGENTLKVGLLLRGLRVVDGKRGSGRGTNRVGQECDLEEGTDKSTDNVGKGSKGSVFSREGFPAPDASDGESGTKVTGSVEGDTVAAKADNGDKVNDGNSNGSRCRGDKDVGRVKNGEDDNTDQDGADELVDEDDADFSSRGHEKSDTAGGALGSEYLSAESSHVQFSGNLVQSGLELCVDLVTSAHFHCHTHKKTSNHTAKDLSNNVWNDLTPWEALEDSKGDRHARVEMTTRGRADDNDGENDTGSCQHGG